VKASLVGGDGWDSPETVKIGGSAIVGGYFTNHYSPERPDKVTQDFIRKYKEKFGAVPDALAALGYDATMILLQSLDKAKKPAAEELMRSLSTMSNYKGVTGTMRFDKNGDAIKSVVILKVEKDGFKYVTTVNP